jgi:hypothetical protein
VGCGGGSVGGARWDRVELEVRSQFAMVRVIAAHPVECDRCPRREEWLIIEWPDGDQQPSDYWISNLPADTAAERLARLARLRWMIELDYRQLKGELGLDHYEGRSYPGFHHHCAIVTAAHGFLTLERQHPNRQRPAGPSLRQSDCSSPSSSAGPAAAPPAARQSTSPTYPSTGHHNASDHLPKSY